MKVFQEEGFGGSRSFLYNTIVVDKHYTFVKTTECTPRVNPNINCGILDDNDKTILAHQLSQMHTVGQGGCSCGNTGSVQE